jgi:cobalt-zinc-cadmium efflux system outer membrane protein
VAGKKNKKRNKLIRHSIMKKYIYIIGLFLLLPSVASAQDELDNYLFIAAENNPGLKARFNEYMAALEVAPQVKTLPDPQLAFGWFISPVETRLGPQQLKVSASQMFPWFGTLKAKENVAIQAAKAKYELFEEARSSLFNQLRSTYYNIYFNNKAIEITAENLTLLNTFQKLAAIKVESGLASALDEYRIEMEIGDLENQLALLKDKQDLLEVIFFNLLNTRDLTEIITPDILLSRSILLSRQEVLDSIQGNNHQLISLALQKDALAYRNEVASNLGLPSFSVGLDYTMIGQGENNLAGTDALMLPKVGITLPLYRNKYRAMINEVVYLQDAKGFEISDKTNFLNSLFEKTWKEYLDADRRIDLNFSQLDLARLSIILLETEYSTGNKNFEEILRMERRVLMYALELEKARADKNASISFINYLMGK